HPKQVRYQAALRPDLIAALTKKMMTAAWGSTSKFYTSPRLAAAAPSREKPVKPPSPPFSRQLHQYKTKIKPQTVSG
ncbi:MAG: hypothetical protein WBX02_12625, partial [Terriglobales bacterium]